MKSNKKQVRSRWLRKLMRVHIVVTALSLGAYFSVAFFNPGFLSYDLRQKYHALANDVTITATVLFPPEKPVVTGVSQCNAGVLSMELDWADDANTYIYDITRDGLPLVSGLSPSGYSDTNVNLDTTYEYVVTAIGPMGPGFSTSDTVSLTTLSLCEPIAVTPTVNIVSFAGRSVDSYGGVPRVFDRRPTFSGTTNIPDAIMQVIAGSPSSFVAEFTANANGYFEWQPPVNFSFGKQLFTVTATDPSDSSRRVSTSLQFEIKEREEHTANPSTTVNTVNPVSTVNTTKENPPVPIQKQGTSAPSEEVVPVEFSVSIKNGEQKIFQGGTLNLFLFIKNISEQYQNTVVPVRFSIIDSKGNVIVSLMNEELLRRGMEIQQQLNIPAYIVAGKYFSKIEILLGETNVSKLEEFTVAETPFLNLGGGTFVTYAEIINNIGWIVLILLIALLLWLFMFMREYGMYLRAIRHIAEQQLMNASFITKRKGVIK